MTKKYAVSSAWSYRIKVTGKIGCIGVEQVKKICLKTFAALSATVLLFGNTCIFAKEIAIPQEGLVDDDLPTSIEFSLMDSIEVGDMNSDNEIDTASIDESDVTVEVKILDEYKIPDFFQG